MTHLLADRMQRLGSETAFEMLAKAKALEAKGREIIHLEIGEPDFPAFSNVVDKGVEGLRAGLTKYTPSAGLMALREGIAVHVSRTRGYRVAPEEVVVTTGGKPIMFYVILAMVNAGDEVMYPNPGFPIYESVIKFAGGVPVAVPLREENDFRLDVDEFISLLSPKTKLVILNSPSNPTGGVLTSEDLEAIAEAVRERDLVILSDEIYDNIVYDEPFQSVSVFPGMREKTVILNGFSKTYSMTGWRAGYGVMPVELAEHMTKLVVNSTSCLAGFTQMACLEALEGPQDEVARRVAEFRKRRDFFIPRLNGIPGLVCRMPRGAFYAFPNIKGFGMSSREMADYLLEAAGVATLWGSSFGCWGEGYLRLSYAASLEDLERAATAIAGALGRLWM
ncbi:MAG: pyridoxal phosphate-dependent aminotransferase [Peptococcaceae bacterium]|nr:pyridoxal phosphate-dependent aminotransferase [Peptococcaceae bacterium]